MSRLDVYSECSRCGARGPGVRMTCPECGSPTFLRLPGLAWSPARNIPSIWRYRDMLPSFRVTVSRGEGLTPLRRIGGVYAKLEGRNPTGSYADRASSVIASYVASSSPGARVRIEYSQDFAYSLAYYLKGTADAEVVVEDPSSIYPSEIIALAEMGARISFGGPADLGYANSLAIEGLKTIAFEVADSAPRVDRIVVPAETGLLALSISKGMEDLREAGVGADFELYAAVPRGSPPYLPSGVRARTVDPESAVEGLMKLARMGIRAKLLSAAALSLAEDLGGGLAVITVAHVRRITGSRRASKLREEVERTIGLMEEATVYEIWSKLRGYSLRGVYKSVASLEEDGTLCAEYRMRRGRKVRVYFKCPSPRGGLAL